jgi:hypothetical protein
MQQSNASERAVLDRYLLDIRNLIPNRPEQAAVVSNNMTDQFTFNINPTPFPFLLFHSSPS